MMFSKFVDRIKGVMDFFVKPELRHQWQGPFNGQRYRQKIFFDILNAIPIKSIVETGTYLGSTTELFVATALPVYSVERSHRAYAYARMRFLLSGKNIRLLCDDSRNFLQNGFSSSMLPKNQVFFYLDAHWGRRNLPLLEELYIIFSACGDPVVMIDDFCVPDSSYTFDSYGPKRTLNLDYINPVLEQHDLVTFFPAVSADMETGGKAGCVIVCRSKEASLIEKQITSLKKYTG